MNDEWTLTDDQYNWFIQHETQIAEAFQLNNFDWLGLITDKRFMNIQEFKALFGEMSFDEAYDRFENRRDAAGEGGDE